MSRHVVKKYRGAGTWAVLHASSDNAGSGVPWARVLQLFDTWREAMDYADRMARTREVVLPRYSLTPRNRRGAYWGARKRGHDYAVFRVKDFAESQVIHVAFDDLRPLAAALLSLAEREEQQ